MATFDRRIFTYWHDPAAMPDYLSLCMDTWGAHCQDYEVVLITDANMDNWITPGTLDRERLGQYPLSQQKDAIEVATLCRYGGIFLDTDTLMAAPPKQLRDGLQQAEIVMYGHHLAAVAARPGSPLMARWLEIMQQVLSHSREELAAASDQHYFQFGNYSLELLREELATGRPAPIPGKDGPVATRLKKLRRRLLVDTAHRDKIKRIDIHQNGYLPERTHFSKSALSKREAYEQFWFNTDIPTTAGRPRKASLIALHHSWTPTWYCELDIDQLKKDQTLLSRVLREMG